MYVRQKERLYRLADRYHLVYQKDPSLAGLLYLHLDPNSQLQGVVCLYDERGQKHSIEIAQRPFVLQRKGKLVADCLAELKREGKWGQLEGEFEKLFTFFLRRASLGLTDRIQTLHNNYAFVQEQPIQIDLGRVHEEKALSLNPREEALRTFQCAGKRLCKRDSSFQPVYEAVLRRHTGS